MPELYKQVSISEDTVVLGIKKEEKPLISSISSKMLLALFLEQQKNIAEVYEQGIQAGKLAGKEENQIQVEAYTMKVENILKQIPLAIENNRLQMCEEITHIVFNIAKDLFFYNYQNPEILEQKIMSILKEINSRQEVELCLHPEDINLLQKGEIQLDTAHLQGIKVSANPAMYPGGCVVKSNHGIFDASLESQLEKFKEVMLQLKARNAHANLA